MAKESAVTGARAWSAQDRFNHTVIPQCGSPACNDLPIGSLGRRIVCAECGHGGAHGATGWRPLTN